MKKFIFLFIFLIKAIFSNAQQPVIVSPQWLNDNINDPNLVMLYTGFVVRGDYKKEHIENSRFLWPEWLAFNTPEGNMFAPTVTNATKILQDLGINKTSKVVVYFKGNDVTIAARIFMTLEHFGLKGQVSFLNGGIEEWKRAGFEVTNKPAIFKKGNFVASTNNLIVDKSYVLNALSNDASTIIDARAKRWYEGDPTGNPRDGHIKGAKNIPYQDMLDSTNKVKSNLVVNEKFSTVARNKTKELVLYCFIGQTACVNYIVGRSLGYFIKVYDGSMQEWSREESLPMVNLKNK